MARDGAQLATMPLHPQSQAMLDRIHRRGTTPFHDLSIEEMRHESQKMHFGFRPDAPAVAEAGELALARPDGPTLDARYYRAAGTGNVEALPLLVWFHGGGWTIGDLASYDVLCRELANKARCAVASVAYRLAPEHKFPAAVEDADFALQWFLDHAGDIAVDARRIAVGGDSAGGNLAAVACLLARDRGGAQPCFQLLVYPATDQRGLRSSHTLFSDGYLLTQASIRRFQNCYFHSEAERADWRASPLLAPDLTGLPPALVLTAEYDPLVDDCLAYAERMRAAGVDVAYSCYAGMIHAFFALGKMFDDANRAVDEAAAALAQAFSRVV